MTNNVWIEDGTTQTWGDSGATNTMTFSALATVAGRVGARADLGGWPRSALWRWYAETEWTSAPTIDGQLEFYLGWWDNDTGPANPTGQLPATDTGYAAAAAGLSKRKNLLFLGGPIVETSAVGPFSAGGNVIIPARYVSLMVYNNASVALKTSSSATFFRLTPVFPDIQ